MGIETKITCDQCGKEIGAPGTGSKGEWIECVTHTPSGAVNLLYRSKTEWAICAKCFGQMRRLLREHENPEVECHLCRELVKKDDAATYYFHKGSCVWESGIKPSFKVTTTSKTYEIDGTKNIDTPAFDAPGFKLVAKGEKGI